MIKSFEKNSKTKNKNEHKKNLNKKELEALEALKKREDIIITNADKGGALVINDFETYMNEANRQLSNTSRPSDPVDFKIFTGEQF